MVYCGQWTMKAIKYFMMWITRNIIKYIDEEVKSWSYMKFPYLKEIGKKNGWYTVGPLARMNTVEFIDTPLAQKEFEEFKAIQRRQTKSQAHACTLGQTDRNTAFS